MLKVDECGFRMTSERKPLSTEDAIYFAGLFDGEGTIVIEKLSHLRASRPGGRTPQYNLRIAMSNTNFDLMRWVKATFGGSLCQSRWAGRSKAKADALKWSTSCGNAAYILGRILPYLKAKRTEAELGLAFNAYASSNICPRMPHKGIHGTLPVSIQILETKESYRLQMRALKTVYKQYS